MLTIVEDREKTSKSTSIYASFKSNPTAKKNWLRTGMKKVVVKVSSLKELNDFYKLAKKNKLPCAVITDAGLTQIKSGKTAVGIGPADDRKIDKITGKLKLLWLNAYRMDK